MRKQNRINRIEARMRKQSNETDPVKRAAREIERKCGYDPIKKVLKEIAEKRDIDPPAAKREYEKGKT